MNPTKIKFWSLRAKYKIDNLKSPKLWRIKTKSHLCNFASSIMTFLSPTKNPSNKLKKNKRPHSPQQARHPHFCSVNKGWVSLSTKPPCLVSEKMEERRQNKNGTTFQGKRNSSSDPHGWSYVIQWKWPTWIKLRDWEGIRWKFQTLRLKFVFLSFFFSWHFVGKQTETSLKD